MPVVAGTSHIIYLFIYLLVVCLFTFNKQISHNKNSEENSPVEPSTMQDGMYLPNVT